MRTELAAGLGEARGVKSVEASDVAQAIVATLRKPRIEVYVPRSAGAVARLAASQHGVVTRSQAAQHDIDRRAAMELVRRGFWIEAIPGVFAVTSSSPTWHQRALIATATLNGMPELSHSAAGRLQGP